MSETGATEDSMTLDTEFESKDDQDEEQKQDYYADEESQEVVNANITEQNQTELEINTEQALPIIQEDRKLDDDTLHQGNLGDEAAESAMGNNNDDDDDDFVPEPLTRKLSIQHPNVVRRQVRFNVDTGERTTRELFVEPVIGLTGPMNPRDRRRKEFLSFGGLSQAAVQEQSNSALTAALQEPAQYRLTSKTRESSSAYITRPMTDHNGLNYLISSFVRWSFQTSFQTLLFVLSVLFFIFATMWAIPIYIAGRVQPECIYIGSLNFETGGDYFIDAFAISWTTFSTVGYGLLGPSVSGDDKCVGINSLTAVEAFFGVLYAGFAGAVIFGKVAKIQSIARIIWSDPIVVRYGSGVRVESMNRSNNGKGNDDDDDEEENNNETEIPCPVLEFRIANQLHSHVGGEIMDANITVWASTLAEFAPASVRKAANLRSKRRRRRQRVPRGGGGGSGDKKNPKPHHHRLSGVSNAVRKIKDIKNHHKDHHDDKKHKDKGHKDHQKDKKHQKDHQKDESPKHEHHNNDDSSNISFEDSISSIPHMTNEYNNNKTPTNEKENQLQAEADAMLYEVSVLQETRKHITMQEDPDGGLIPSLIYSKLDVETDSHPFFKRVWIVRHILNETSPLLSERARTGIRNNNGFWPSELNNYKSVREHLQFKELMVVFSGTANVSGSSVYSQKTYDFVDVNVGYRFVTILLGSRNDAITVDTALINDVVEQHGGGAEPFTDVVLDQNLQNVSDAYENGKENLAAELANDAPPVLPTIHDKEE